jgi:hypothetical protein
VSYFTLGGAFVRQFRGREPTNRFDRQPLTSGLPRSTDIPGEVGMSQRCHEPTFHDKNVRHHAVSSSSKAFACFRSTVSKPSVNQL